MGKQTRSTVKEVPAPPGSFYRYGVPRLPPVSFYRVKDTGGSRDKHGTRTYERLFTGTVVRFVRVIRVPACARVSRVSRVCPGSPRCLFTGTVELLQ